MNLTSAKRYLDEKHALASAYIHQHPEFLIHKTLRRIFYYWTGFWSISMQNCTSSPTSREYLLRLCMTFFMLRAFAVYGDSTARPVALPGAGCLFPSPTTSPTRG